MLISFLVALKFQIVLLKFASIFFEALNSNNDKYLSSNNKEI